MTRKTPAKIAAARTKFANGPAKAMAERCPTVLAWKASGGGGSSDAADTLATFASPWNLT